MLQIVVSVLQRGAVLDAKRRMFGCERDLRVTLVKPTAIIGGGGVRLGPQLVRNVRVKLER